MPRLPLRSLATALALALMITGCVEEIPREQAKIVDKEAGALPVKPLDTVPDNGPSANAPALRKDLLDPMVENAPSGRYGGTLFLPAYEDPKTFNPTLVQDATSARFLAYAFDSLVEEDGITFKIKGALAKSWDLLPDGKTYIFHLRRGVKWHDGAPFTADDVVFTFMDVVPNADIPDADRDGLKIDNKLPVVSKIDDYTVKFVLPKPFAPFLRTAGIFILPKHIWAPWLATKGPDGKPISNSKWGVDADLKTIVGTGPFMFDSYSPGERIVMKRNPNYYRVNRYKQPLPYLDKVSVPFLKSLDTAILKFKAGETDTQWMPGKDYAYMKPLEKEGNFRIYNAGPVFQTTYLAFNLNPGQNKDGKPYVDPIKLKWFADRRFRQAMSYAINRKADIKAVYRGLAVAQNSPVFSESPYYDTHLPPMVYDLGKAAALLSEAGFKKVGGQLQDAEGHPVKFDLMVEAGSQEATMEANMLKEDLANLGIQIGIQIVTFNVDIARTQETKDWEATLGQWGAGVDPHVVNSLWTSNGQYHFFDLNPSDKAPTHWNYPWEKEIDDLYDQGATTVDETKRKAIYDKFQEIVAREQPLILRPTYLYTVAVRNTVGNADPSAYSQITVSWNIYELYKKQ